jgi:hypothetical protein
MVKSEGTVRDLSSIPTIYARRGGLRGVAEDSRRVADAHESGRRSRLDAAALSAADSGAGVDGGRGRGRNAGAPEEVASSKITPKTACPHITDG